MRVRTVDDVLEEWEAAWRERTTDVPFARWRVECDDPWADDAVIQIEALDTPDWRAGRDVRDALAARREVFFPALALALRDPRYNVWTRALEALSPVEPKRHAELEAALLSLLVAPPPPAYEAAPPLVLASFRAVAEHPWSPDGAEALTALASDGDPISASSAAIISSQPAQLGGGLEALRAWSARRDVPEDIASRALEHVVPAVETHRGVPRSGEHTLRRLRALLARPEPVAGSSDE
ncbi:MAG: hypothetical protein VYE22_06950 [Myxococcota bacterium]|nr:hypothetical protein [Myxococcota bacterium]